MRIILVEDNMKIVTLLKRLLIKQNYTVDHFDSIALAFEALQSVQYDLVLLDRGLPDGDGLNLIRKLVKTKHSSDIPSFLILSAFGETRDLVKGLDAGAVDYITKPYEPEELLARIRAGTRKSVGEAFKYITLGNLSYSPQQQIFKIEGEIIHLPRRQFVILDLLMRNKNIVLPYARLESAVYGYDDDVMSNSIASQISRLRKYLSDSNAGVHINVLRGRGYVLEAVKK